eukprot:SAG31_NODE_25126_length_467_cov_1.119565_1_plen_106_part_01
MDEAVVVLGVGPTIAALTWDAPDAVIAGQAFNVSVMPDTDMHESCMGCVLVFGDKEIPVVDEHQNHIQINVALDAAVGPYVVYVRARSHHGDVTSPSLLSSARGTI